MTEFPEVFNDASTTHEPKFEFIFEIRLQFTLVQNIANMPTGSGRGASMWMEAS